MLTIVPTPIGNLKDISLRAMETLKSSGAIICEDTRRTSLLLNHFEIHKPLLVLNDYNEAKVFPQILEKLKNGENLALVSDGGTPLISDPGYKLVRECLSQNIEVDSLPGASALVTALTLSGLPPDKFVFLGYLPEKQGKRIDLLTKLSIIHCQLSITFIAYVPPHKLVRTLQDMQEVFGDIDVCLAKELTKIYQSIKSQSINSWLEQFKQQPPKGEFVLLFNLTSDK